MKRSLVFVLACALLASCGRSTPAAAPATRQPIPAASSSPTAAASPAAVAEIATPTVVPADAAAAAPASPAPTPDYWPTDGWRTSTPEAQGMDAARLAQLFDAIDAQNVPVDGVVVVRNGYIVAEKYYARYSQDTRHTLYSVTKSVVSTLVGMALADGAIGSVDQPVLSFFPDRRFKKVDQRKQAMTLENVLTMTSGLDWPESDELFGKLYRSSDWVGFMLDRPMAEDPGTTFNYCSGCSHLLSAIVEEATGQATLDYARQRLFEPLGITNLSWELDPNGIAIGGWGLELTPRDMAKLGYLYLHDGAWAGQQIVPAEWVQASTQKHVTADDGLDYGYQWWRRPDLNAYFARGRAGQLIVVRPDLNLIVVFTARMEKDAALFELVRDYIIPAAG